MAIIVSRSEQSAALHQQGAKDGPGGCRKKGLIESPTRNNDLALSLSPVITRPDSRVSHDNSTRKVNVSYGCDAYQWILPQQ